MKRNFHLVLHPFLFALYAVSSLVANNIIEVQLEALRAGVISLLAAIIMMGILWLLLKDVLKAGLITSGFIILSFSYGHIGNLLSQWSPGGFNLGQDRFLTPLWILLFSGWVYLILWHWRGNEVRLNGVSWYLNWVSLILNIFPVYTILSFSAQTKRVKPWFDPYITQAWQTNGVETIQTDPLPLKAQGNLPDIYYFIFDAYTRDDVLAELYNYDNAPFIQALEQRGFYVARKSHSNYSDTVLSIASSLNMMQINTIPEYFQENAQANGYWIIRSTTARLVQENRSAAALRQAGYQFVAFDSGYGLTQIKLADEYVTQPAIDAASNTNMMFEMMLFDNSLGRLYTRLRGNDFAPQRAMFQAHRQQVLFTSGEASKWAAKQGNYFVFAHIVAPHTPYVFGPNGEELKNLDPYTLMDMHPGQAANIDLYSGQVNYINQLILKMIDEIMAKSDTPPIIILQGDHSSRVYNTLNQPIDLKLKLMFPIFNAYHFPGDGAKELYPTITPVNSFRVVLNYYFGAGLPLLPDLSYWYKTDQWGRVEFIDVCRVYQVCLP